MSGPAWAGARLGFEAFGTSVGLAMILGSLSILVPGFVPVTGTLAALAVAGWASLPRRGGSSRRSAWSSGLAALLVVLLGAGAYLDPPALLAPYRGLGIALGLLPLWWIERHGRPRRAGGGLLA